MSNIESETSVPHHQPVVTHQTDWSLIHESAFVADSALIRGHVEIGREASVWFGAIMRGDVERIVIGERSNVQDGCSLHCDPGTPCLIGREVTIGHQAVVHGAVIGDGALIGISSIILNGAKIGEGAVVAAGALVTENLEVPPGMIAMGSPAKVIKPVGQTLGRRMIEGTQHYVDMSRRYRTLQRNGE